MLITKQKKLNHFQVQRMSLNKAKVQIIRKTIFQIFNQHFDVCTFDKKGKGKLVFKFEKKSNTK